MMLSKSKLGILVRNVTGHVHLARHNDLIQPNNSIDYTCNNDHTSFIDNSCTLDEVDTNKHKHRTICRLCKLRGMEETPLHLALDCPVTWRERAELFRKYEVNDVDLHSWEPDALVRFFTHYNLEQ